jgi:hypothetical protein
MAEEANAIAPTEPDNQLQVVKAINSAAPTQSAKVLRESVAILFWLYVILKLFVFDVDVYVAQMLFPTEAWLLDFKFIILVCFAAGAVLTFRSFSIVVWIAYVGFYPLVVLFWKIPRWLYKTRSWVIAFAALNATVSFFRSIKYNLIVSALALTAVAVAFEATNVSLLWSAAVLLLLILLVTYFRRFILVFRPNLLFQIYTTAGARNRESQLTSAKLAENLKNLPVESLDDTQLKAWAASLEKPVLYNRLCLFLAKTLRTYQQSGMSFIFGVATVLTLVVGTSFVFAVINFVLFKIDPSNFDTAGTPSFFKFVYYSFNTLVFSGIKELDPATVIAQALSMTEKFLALFLIGIFAASMISVRSQRYSDQLNAVIAGLEEDGRIMESFIRDEYRMASIEEALMELEKLKASMGFILGYLTRNLE